MSDSGQVAAARRRHHHSNSQRSLSTSTSTFTSAKPLQNTPPRPVSKSISASHLHAMAAVSKSPGIPTPRSIHSYDEDDDTLSTIPDPRSRMMTPASEDNSSIPSHHPDLSSEVATLSNKLINAINHQTNLDDALSATRHELEASRERVRQLEQESQEHSELLAGGLLIKTSVAEADKRKLTLSLNEERRQRAEIEKEKKEIEQELENLTTALFEEANKMVITAREEAQKEHDILQRRNDQLKAQLADTESLLKSQQEQLAELKQVMEHMTEACDDQTNPTAPSTPGLSRFDNKDENPYDADRLHSSSSPEPVSPSYPTSFTHLLHTVLRTDLAAYDDFTSLLRMSKNVVVGSRVSSGSYGGSIGLGLGLGGYSASQQAPTNGSTSSLSTAGTIGSSPATPTTPASTASAGSTNGPNSLTPLKETKFYKRALAEDIEPTLRLDTAPGLSWLARRTVLNSVCEGTLIVEPVPTSTKLYSFACSLCGETRKGAAHARTHRFRTSENDNAQRYSLCKYCLGRVRSTCDFLGFLRVLKDGHWRADDEESERAAWEEGVRLREQMFWCRIGGGVVPAHHGQGDNSRSPRMSEEQRRVQERELSEELERTGDIKPKDVTPAAEGSSINPEPKLSKVRKSIGGKDTAEGLWQAAQNDAQAPSPIQEPKIDDIADFPMKEPGIGAGSSIRDSTQSTSPLQVSSPGGDGKDEAKRLSITIPGSSN
ncbi:hypothetical protein B7494_g6443 [Chlorociboria aeruginascens]|nr:hypothetical protein B7494_g6443 [Chlorociboria aeruginascens]